jgi:hypothetical protein
MLDRACDERAVKRTVEHTRHQFGRRRRPQAQPHRREAAMEFGEQGRQANGCRRFHRSDRERSLWFAIVARG